MTIVTLAAAMLFVTCSKDTINLDPIGDNEAGFFENEEQMTQGVIGIYQKLAFFYTFRGGSWLSGIWLLPDDNITTEGTHGYENFIGLNQSDGFLGLYYQYAYQLIARANVILQKVDENPSEVYSRSPELKDYHKGEALFLRAWMYFRLWNTYGSAAPLIDSRIIELDDAYPPSSSGTELLDRAIDDLQQAAQLLPDGWDAENLGRVTKNSARGLCGKILVFRGTVNNNQGDFSQAVNQFRAMQGVSLTPNYKDNFSAASENNVESLFEYQANDQASFNNVFLNNDDFAVVGDISNYLGMFTREPAWIGANQYLPSQSLIDAYEPGDPRLVYTLDLATTTIVKYSRDGQRIRNWGGSYNANINNVRILRFADTQLLLAEALVRSGGSKSEAIDLINHIRERARKSTEDGIEATVPAALNVNETDATVILNWIYQERRIELACEEGHRWYDLRRRHLAGEIDLTTWDFSSLKPDFDFKANNLVFPIPANEVVQNPNLIQNPGY